MTERNCTLDPVYNRLIMDKTLLSVGVLYQVRGDMIKLSPHFLSKKPVSSHTTKTSPPHQHLNNQNAASKHPD